MQNAYLESDSHSKCSWLSYASHASDLLDSSACTHVLLDGSVVLARQGSIRRMGYFHEGAMLVDPCPTKGTAAGGIAIFRVF